MVEKRSKIRASKLWQTTQNAISNEHKKRFDLSEIFERKGIYGRESERVSGEKEMESYDLLGLCDRWAHWTSSKDIIIIIIIQLSHSFFLIRSPFAHIIPVELH